MVYLNGYGEVEKLKILKNIAFGKDFSSKFKVKYLWSEIYDR